MDGVYTSEYRKVFLLTTNELNINENLLSRPSRIRYVREFGNLEREIIEEFLDDELIDQSCRESVIDYVDSLTISTIDILKAIVEEINIHGIDAFLEYRKSFNVQNATYTYSCLCGTIDIDEVREKNYTIETFLKELKSYRDRFKAEEKLNADIEACSSDEERDEVRKKYWAESRRCACFDYETIFGCEKQWNKLKPGKDIFDGYKVVKVDIDNKVVVTERYSCLEFHYIENPNAKPSLYNEKNVYNKYAL
jgi:hypothetical protein